MRPEVWTGDFWIAGFVNVSVLQIEWRAEMQLESDKTFRQVYRRGNEDLAVGRIAYKEGLA